MKKEIVVEKKDEFTVADFIAALSAVENQNAPINAVLQCGSIILSAQVTGIEESGGSVSVKAKEALIKTV